ncbi:MAG: hypothetical protein HYX72_02340 [Acidobacteria bacterium]|nr:hypothetical protein [Acidobacteriota bacterium]
MASGEWRVGKIAGGEQPAQAPFISRQALIANGRSPLTTCHSPLARHPERGAVNIYFIVIAGTLLFGFMFFAVDFGRLYLIQAELQTAADAAALAAAKGLVGTANSTVHATQQLNASFDNTDAGDNRVNLRQNQLGAGASGFDPQISFDFFSTRTDALSAGGSGGATGADAKYVRVTMSVQVPLFFGKFINTNLLNQTVVASAVAGMSGPVCSACGIDSLAVVDPSGGSDPVNFGLSPGNFYTLYLTNSLATSTGCNVTAPSALNGTDGNILLEYTVLNRTPAIQQSDPDSTLFSLGAGGMQQADSVVIGQPETPAADSYSSCPGQEILCGLNTRFGVDSSLNACGDGSIAGGLFVTIASQYMADTDVGANTYNAGVGLQDFATEYDLDDAPSNLRRVLTVPLVDSVDSLNVVNFAQFLVEPSDTVSEGVDPSLNTGAFRAQYITTLSGSSPVPLRCVGSGGECNVQFGAGRTVLH